MARDQTQRPMTDEEIEALREEMRAQRSEIRADLAEHGVEISGWDTGEDEADPGTDREQADSD